MQQPPKKTHTESKNPRISAARLADYMAASEQSKRSIAASCKYRPIARVVQHNDAKVIISNYLRTARGDKDHLAARLEALENKICDDQFESDVRDHNCDYIERFASVDDGLILPDAELIRATKLTAIPLSGVLVSFQPDIFIARTTRTNKRRLGALMLRYSKGRAVDEEAALYQSAFIHGYLSEQPFEEHASPELKLCVVADAYSGDLYEAPGNSKYLFKEMRAACASIAERWPSIKPPKGAVL